MSLKNDCIFSLNGIILLTQCTEIYVVFRLCLETVMGLGYACQKAITSANPSLISSFRFAAWELLHAKFTGELYYIASIQINKYKEAACFILI